MTLPRSWPTRFEIGPVERIASYSGTLYLLRPGDLALLEGKTFVPEPVALTVRIVISHV